MDLHRACAAAWTLACKACKASGWQQAVDRHMSEKWGRVPKCCPVLSQWCSFYYDHSCSHTACWLPWPQSSHGMWSAASEKNSCEGLKNISQKHWSEMAIEVACTLRCACAVMTYAVYGHVQCTWADGTVRCKASLLLTCCRTIALVMPHRHDNCCFGSASLTWQPLPYLLLTDMAPIAMVMPDWHSNHCHGYAWLRCQWGWELGTRMVLLCVFLLWLISLHSAGRCSWQLQMNWAVGVCCKAPLLWAVLAL